MERPFDCPDMAEPTGFDPHQLRRKEGFSLCHTYDAFGGVADHVTMWFAPDWWTDDEVKQAIAWALPPERCYHEHDCCGHYYSNGGRVLHIKDGVRDDNDDKARAVIVLTSYTQNV